uniref:(northern house mosquito) hypothetical protein n=1 Tax=Culex pipiens TaxID=7175 RepID=A0A8D7ZWI4_CULPI
MVSTTAGRRGLRRVTPANRLSGSSSRRSSEREKVDRVLRFWEMRLKSCGGGCGEVGVDSSRYSEMEYWESRLEKRSASRMSSMLEAMLDSDRLCWERILRRSRTTGGSEEAFGIARLLTRRFSMLVDEIRFLLMMSTTWLRCHLLDSFDSNRFFIRATTFRRWTSLRMAESSPMRPPVSTTLSSSVQFRLLSVPPD